METVWDNHNLKTLVLDGQKTIELEVSVDVMGRLEFGRWIDGRSFSGSQLTGEEWTFSGFHIPPLIAK